MSNRTLLEINHDQTHEIAENREEFVTALVSYLRSGSREQTVELERFGITFRGRRHHSDGFAVAWGGHYDSRGSRP